MQSGHKHIIVQSPPRTGKTVVMAEIAKRTTDKNNQIMFIIHRKEVLDQTKKSFIKQNANMDLATMGMVQTLTRRLDKLPEPQLILIDEAHHALAKSYKRILNKYPNAFVLLFTATPKRVGHNQLDLVADDIIVGQSIKELTKQGFLAPFKYFAPPQGFDLKQIKKNSTGDYTNKSMEQAQSSTLYGDIVKQYKKTAKDKQAVVYTYSVESAKDIAKRFRKADISAEEVDGETDKTIREEIVNDFKNRKIKILVNVNLFTEGVDLPNVDCVIMARPTASLALYLQFSMRCLNPREHKTALIIDHAENWKRFGFPDKDRDWAEAIKTGKKISRQEKDDLQIVTCDNCFAVIDRAEIKDNICPYCGKKINETENKHDIKHVDEELVELDRNKLEQLKAGERRVKLAHELMENNIKKNVVGKSINELRGYPEFKAYAELHDYSKGWAYTMWVKKGKHY